MRPWLAHEIGQFSFKHVLKMLGLSAFERAGRVLPCGPGWTGQAWFGQGFGLWNPTVASTTVAGGFARWHG